MSPGPPLDELRPLVCATAYPDKGGLTFAVDDRDVHLDGDPGFIGGVLACCDGQRSVAEIADQVGSGTPEEVRELIGGLREQGVVCDCSDAWRHFDYQSSVRSGLYRPVSQELLAELLQGSSSPAASPVRSVPVDPRPSQLGALTAARRSARATDDAHEVSFTELSTLLAAMYGSPSGARRPVPSGGGLYPLLLHVYLRRPCGPLEPGVWWFDAGAAALGLLAADPPGTYDLFLPDNTCAELLEREQPVVFLSADIARAARKYSNRAYRFALIEAGATMQNAYLAAAELGLPIRAAAGFDELAAHARLHLDDGSVALLSLLLGS